MSALSLRLVVALALILTWGGLGYLAGDRNRNNIWLAKQAVQEHAARLALQAETRRSDAATRSALATQAALQLSYQTLEDKFHELKTRAPLVVYRTVSAVGSDHDFAQRNSGSDPNAAKIEVTAQPVPALDLSLGAVWMYNSALAGNDVPAGACSAADTASAACAAGSGLGLDALWRNHTTNAKSCAADRLRFQQLIDFLQAWPGAKHHD